jgi:hypothetical protein
MTARRFKEKVQKGYVRQGRTFAFFPVSARAAPIDAAGALWDDPCTTDLSRLGAPRTPVKQTPSLLS